MGTKVIFEKLGIDGIESLKGYQKNEGYEGLKKALNDYTPDELIEYIKGSGLRGRGGFFRQNMHRAVVDRQARCGWRRQRPSTLS